MRTFAQKQTQPQNPVSSSPNMATPGLNHRTDLILHLQRRIRNQAVLRMLQTPIEEPEAGLTGAASRRFGHDFSQIPIYPHAVGLIQTKPAINKPGDKYEQDADHFSDQVMRMPKPQLQHALASGGGGSKFQTEQSGLGQERSQTRHIESSDLGQTAVPYVVNEVIASPGQPLDAATRAFMVPRFGHDFAQVRVHTDAKAAESARAVDALAYTVGRDIVFSVGQYAPQTTTGRRLLAHELTHVVQQSGMRLLQRSPDTEAEGKSESAADSPYPEESNVIAYAVGAQKLGKLAEGMVLFATKDWKAVAMSQSAFYVGPLLSDMNYFYYVYRFRGLDEKTGTYTLTRGAYAPGRGEKDLQAALAKVQGKTTVQVKTSGLSPVSSGGSTTKDPGAPTGAKDTGSTRREPGVRQGSDKPSQAADILPEFADKTVDQCREIVGDIYGGLNKEANSGILDHKLDAVVGMETILDKTDPAVSSNVIFALSLVTGVAAGALGAGLPTIAANAIIWGAAGAVVGATTFFNNENLIDAVEFCQKYMQSLRMTKDAAVEKVRAAMVGDLAQVRLAASAIRRLVRDADQISKIKLNQEREVVDLWTNTILATKESKQGRKVGGSGDPGKVGGEYYSYATEARILLASGQLEAKEPPAENPFRWVKSPDAAAMPGVPDRARQKNLNRKIGEVPVVRTMRVATSANYFLFAVAMSADGTETAQPQPYRGNPQDSMETMHWILSSFLLDRALNPSTDDFERLIEPNWKLGITKCWDQVRNKTFADIGIKSIQGERIP